MLKYWPVLAGLIFGLTCRTWPQVPRNGSQQNQPTQRERGDSKPLQPPPPAIQIEPSPSKQEQQSGTEPSGYNWRELYSPASIPNWALVLVGGWAGLMALRTLRAINDQAGIMTRADRPWLTVAAPRAHERLFTANPPGKFPIYADGITITFTNIGKSVARITGASIQFSYVGIDGINSLPDEPQFTKAFSVANRLVAPGEPYTVNIPMTQAEWLQSRNLEGPKVGQHFVYVWGFIHDADSHGDGHISRFGLTSYITMWGDHRKPELGPTFYAAGPPAYNNYT